MDLLRFCTAGSVDDGKSTLIGRLLFDSKSIFQDQMDQLEHTSKLRGEEGVNLALLTDGLRSEREQGITIDVAYRYFSTPKRRFIIADTPGHEQYTRNMVTGSSTADLSIILIDARNGVSTQSRRHGFITSLLGVPHMIVAVNKMDLVDFSKQRFDEIVEEYTEFSKKLDIQDIQFIPISALNGDNVVTQSENMPWYEGTTVLHQLENVTIAADKNLVDFRFPVQTVIRPNQDFRGYAGKIASGSIKVGEEVIALPSFQQSKIKEILAYPSKLEEASVEDSVVLSLEDEIDISRGEMIVRKNNVPEKTQEIDAIICWMDSENDLDPSKSYYLLHTTNSTQCFVSSVLYNINVNTLHREFDHPVSLNCLARVALTTSQPIFCDLYSTNKATGSFVLVDRSSHQTVAAGMIKSASHTQREIRVKNVSTNVVYDASEITLAERESRQGHKGLVVWLTGLSGSGKSTIGKTLERSLFDRGLNVSRLDGDNLRHGLCGDLGFSATDRTENVRRAAETARLMYELGNIVICSFVSPFSDDRNYAKGLIDEGRFVEVFVDCSLETCIARDSKGLYKQALAGKISDFTGVSSPYNRPAQPDVIINTDQLSTGEGVSALESFLVEKL